MTQTRHTKAPAPSDSTEPVESAEGWLREAAGAGPRLYWQARLPAGEPRGVVAVVHGLSEHGGRHRDLLDHLARRGWAAYAVDLRGCGRSDGPRAHVDGPDDYRHDLDAFAALLAARHPEAPRVLLGHSMGGLLALDWIQAAPRSERRDTEGAIRPTAGGFYGLGLSSPALGTHPDSQPSKPIHRLALLLSRILPRLRVPTQIAPGLLSRDPRVNEAFLDDPLVYGSATPRWYTSFLAIRRRALAHEGPLSVPTLLLQAGDDRIVDPAASRRFAQEHDEVEYHELEGFFHEIFHEVEKEQALARLDAWLDALA